MKKTLLATLIPILIMTVGFANKDVITNSNKTITLIKLNKEVWVHTTYGNYNGSSTPSNGLIVITDKGIVLIDTPWTNEETEDLIKLTKKEFKKDIVLALITHAHVDRIGGIDTLLKHKITIKSTKLTAELAVKNGFNRPNSLLNSTTTLKVGSTTLETYYPGPGHTVDNIIVWLPDYKILFGGCLIKSEQATDLGNINDADIKAWPKSITKVMNKYPSINTVIPGHGPWGGAALLKHTLDLF